MQVAEEFDRVRSLEEMAEGVFCRILPPFLSQNPTVTHICATFGVARKRLFFSGKARGGPRGREAREARQARQVR
jgi:hypothetical protein